jgi:hypothetical protein
VSKDEKKKGREQAGQLSLDLKPKESRQRTAEVVSIARQKAIAVRDVLIRDLIASKTPAPPDKKK